MGFYIDRDGGEACFIPFFGSRFSLLFLCVDLLIFSNFTKEKREIIKEDRRK